MGGSLLGVAALAPTLCKIIGASEHVQGKFFLLSEDPSIGDRGRRQFISGRGWVPKTVNRV